MRPAAAFQTAPQAAAPAAGNGGCSKEGYWEEHVRARRWSPRLLLSATCCCQAASCKGCKGASLCPLFMHLTTATDTGLISGSIATGDLKASAALCCHHLSSKKGNKLVTHLPEGFSYWYEGSCSETV